MSGQSVRDNAVMLGLFALPCGGEEGAAGGEFWSMTVAILASSWDHAAETLEAVAGRLLVGCPNDSSERLTLASSRSERPSSLLTVTQELPNDEADAGLTVSAMVTAHRECL